MNQFCQLLLARVLEYWEPANKFAVKFHLNRGVVSETGFGDGSYSLYVGKNNEGKIVSASIIFIADDEMEEF